MAAIATRESQPASPRRAAIRYAAIAFGLCAGLLLTEIGMRLGHWTPPSQIVRGFGLHSVDGVPVWEVSTDRENRACVEQHPERTRILLFGSSITYGDGLAAPEVFSAGLETRLNQLRPTPGFCVLNFAQNGFTFEQKYAVARAEVARYKPALILWESWNDWLGYSLIGNTAYGTAGYLVRPDGFIGIAGVPDGVNRTLLLHSRLYEYLTLTFGERIKRPAEQVEVKRFVDQRLVELSTLAQSVGAKLVLYLAPPLDRAFAASAASPPAWHRVFLDFAQAHNIPATTLQHELIDQDYLALRRDTCCHYNADGHRALVPVMERIVLAQLDGALPPP